MKATVKKWGNSAAVRIPVSVMKATHLNLDEVVEVREEKGRIVIKSINSRNLYDVIDFGPPVGKEVW